MIFYKRRLKLLVVFFVIVPQFLLAQVKEIGTPFIKNYPRKTTQAGQQNWMIDQDSSGIMFFANNEGLLEYNGFDWFLTPLPNHSIVRSIKVYKGLIYAGGFNELGYFEREITGNLHYKSIVSLLPENSLDFGEIWKIHQIGNDIVFQSFKFLIFFNGSDIYRIIPAPGLFHFSFELAGELYVNDIENGIYRVAPESLVPIPGLELLKGKEIWGMEALKDGILIATADEGLFFFKNNILKPWKTAASEYLKKNQIYCILRLADNNLAIGTIQNGLLVCNNEGEIIKILNRGNGLQNNTILSMKQDAFRNLWLGLDNGIDYLQINSPFSYFSHADGLSAGYASASYKDQLYFGTNQGVFVKSWSALKGDDMQVNFSLIEETRGQVWSLDVIDDKLFCGHNKGFFLLENGHANMICDKPGGWMLSRVPSHNEIMIGGTYNGFVLFRKSNNQWKYIQDVVGFDESARIFEWENDRVLLMSHGLKGIYRVYFSPNYDSIVQFELYGKKDGLPSDFNLEIGNIKGENLISSSAGIYSFDQREQTFYLNQEKTNLFEGQFPVKLIEDKERNIWFFTNENLGVLRKQEDGSFSSITSPFTTISNSYINGFQHLNAIDTRNVIFGSDNGFIHYDPGISKEYDYSFQVYISQIGFLKKDSVLTNTNIIQLNSQSHPFNNKENHLVFYFGASDYENTENLLFAAILEGYDKDWDSWSIKRTREYTNLTEGVYTFRVQAKNGFRTIGKQASYTFEILPPWYKTWWAYVIYFILILLTVIAIVYILELKTAAIKRKEKINQLRLSRQNENLIKREKLQAEKELIRLKNEQLKTEVVIKDKELANSTMQMIQKNKLLNRLKLELSKMNSKTTDDLVQSSNQALIRRINKELEDTNQWRVFEEHFEAVHEDFLNRLQEQYPELTPGERKLAAYLRLNISTKEIALLMNISARGVEVARYRLRRKFKLEREVNLMDFILRF